MRDFVAFLQDSVWSLSGFTFHSTPISLFTFLGEFLSHACGMSGSGLFKWGRWGLWEEVWGFCEVLVKFY